MADGTPLPDDIMQATDQTGPCFQIRPNYRVEIVEPNHVYLLSEHASHALSGRLYCAVVPYLDGQYTREQIYAAFDGAIRPEVIDVALDRLLKAGFLTELSTEIGAAAAAFWSELGFDAGQVFSVLTETQVGLVTIGAVEPGSTVTNLAAQGVTVKQRIHPSQLDWAAEDLELLIVLTDDYLRPELAQINAWAKETGTAWMSAKPGGSMPWIGPVFVPGETGCWSCLTHRLGGNVDVKASIARQRGGSVGDPTQACFPTAHGALAPTLAMAEGWIATEAVKWVVQATLGPTLPNASAIETLSGQILTFDHLNLATEHHAAPRRPQCKVCGDPTLVAVRGFEPIHLSPSPKSHRQDGGHRSVTPERTLAKYDHLVSPITGVVTEISRISAPENDVVHTYKAAHSMGAVGSLRGLRKVLAHTASGKGKTDAQAKVSGLCEAIERFSFIHQGDEPTQRATQAEMGEAAIPPNALLHFSEAQYADRDALNESAAMTHDWVPQRFDPTRSIDWTPVWSLTEQRQRFLPSAYCYQWYPLPKDHQFCRADSNGNAAGSTREDAILQGLLEVVERDGVALWWYNAVQRPQVDLASFNDPYFDQMHDFYAQIGRVFWVLDLTTDLEIPVMAAVSRRITGGSERLIIGYGAHLDPALAAVRAVTEMSQVGLELDKLPNDALDLEAVAWLTEATLASKPYLAPHPDLPVRRASDYASNWSDDIRDDVEAAVGAARRIGVETLVLDLTRPDIGLPVVKVVMPGLRFFWQRFAPGRLYDAPVAMGWRDTKHSEAGLNRTPMPF